MKTLKIFLSIVLLSVVFAFNRQDQLPKQEETGNTNLRSIKHHAYQPGEVLEYRLHYGLVNAGVAKLEVNSMENKIAGREVYHIVGTGRSKGAFDWFFKVRDRYETYMDAEGAFPWMFVRDVSEGGYKIKQKYKFMQKKKKVDNGKGKTFEAPEGIQDMLSSFYYARTIDFKKAKEKEIFTIWSFVDDEIWPLRIRFMGRETIKVSGKKYKAMKFHPVVQEGRLFENEEDVTVWISDDENKIPLLAQGKVLIGSVKMELTKYSGLANPIAKVK
jgi:hypothetical protein